MTFASIEFIFFYIIVFFVYWVVCRKNKNAQNLTILVSSLLFYGWWDWRCLFLLIITVFSTFGFGYGIEKYKDSRKTRRLLLFFSIFLNIGILFFFKYFNFFIISFVDAFSFFGETLNISTIKIILPIGISFYTFSALSYVFDVYQNKTKATKDFLAYAAYVSFFPAILSGPISRSTKQLPQYMHLRQFDYNNAVRACKILIMGG